MRLLFVTNLYPPYVVGGNELLCDDVVRALRARGHEVFVLCGRGRDLPRDMGVVGTLELDLDRKEETLLGGRVPYAGEAIRLHLFSLASYGATRRAIREQAPDVIIVWNLYMASLAPLVAVRHSGRPVVVHVSDKWLYFGLFDIEALLQATVPWKRAALALARRTVQPLLRLLAPPRGLVAISAFLKAFYVRAGVPEAEIEVIHLGVRTDLFTSLPRPPRPAAQPLRLLFVGSLWEGKGPHTAVRALGRIRRAGVKAHLDVCGDGPASFARVLANTVAEEGVADDVTFHGRVERDAVRRFTQTHDVFVFPSEWDEPFAAVPIEAMSAGMAIVATTAGGTPEAIVDGETGLLVPPRDPDALAHALLRLAGDGELCRRLGRNAAEVARARFDFNAYVDRLEARYRSASEAGS
jgi:glycosyltransferase involved in cell wall biosynthesis